MKKVFIGLFTFLMVLSVATVYSADPTKGTLRMSGDNTWEAYIDGEKVGEGADWQKVGIYNFSIKGGSFVVAIHVHDAEPGASGKGGFLADIVLDNKVYIATGDKDKSGVQTWKCSDDSGYMKNKDWINPKFDDSKWMEPTLYEQFGAGIWGFGAGAMKANGLQEPDCKAFWCWAGPNDVADEVFFRYSFGIKLAVEANGKATTTWGTIKSSF